MIEPTHALPVSRQAALLDISRANVYYLPRPVCAADLVLMRRLDELHLQHPFAGSRMLRDMLKLERVEIGRRHVRTLMGLLGIATLYRKPNTSAAHPAHRIYPYLLRGMDIARPNQVWATDVSAPCRRGRRGSLPRRLVANRQLKCCPARERYRAEGGCKVLPCADGGMS